MNKILVKSDLEFIFFFVKKFSCPEDFEYEAGIQFSDQSGRYEDDKNFDLKNLNYFKYRVKNPGRMPQKYPCIVVYHSDEMWNLVWSIGKSENKIFFEFIYINDFWNKEVNGVLD